MNIIRDVVRVFIENGEKKAVLIRNGHAEFFLLKKATNDDIDRLLGVDGELKVPKKPE